MVIIKILTTLAFLGSMAWLIFQPGWEPGITAIITLIALIAEISVQRKTDSKTLPTQQQKVGDGSTTYQAGRDIKITSESKDKNVRK